MPKCVVITGGTRGLGLAMAAEFLDRGHRVAVSGRSEQSVRRAVDGFAIVPDRILGVVADSRRPDELERLWAEAAGRFGPVDFWINNAGLGQTMAPLWELPAAELAAVIETDLTGLACGCRVAMRGMLAQGHGCIFNMEGLGSDGRRVAGLSVYGAAKRAVRYLTEGLVEEARGTPVRIASLSPVMLAADRPETVARFLVDRMLQDPPHGARIAWLGGPKILGRLLAAAFRRRKNPD